ncbi:hypothetical protein ACO2Q3_21325 [Caulobacter sp. KR2-114]|uniref:hypothetical protein n=1 Tax=Caulobacter sp. KR2-114 TaxID=3400912 RepID=UPI003C113331
MGPGAAQLKRRGTGSSGVLAAVAIALGWLAPSGGQAAPAAATAPAPVATSARPAVVLPFPGLAPVAATSATAKPHPPRRPRHPPARHVAAAPPPPPPPAAERRVGDNVQLNLAELPASARQALLDLHDRLAAGGPCRGISLSAFELGLTPIVATRYNEDDRPDFFFHDPCSGGGARAEGSTLLLLSDPLGYHLSPTFAAALGEIEGRPVLLAHAPCNDGAPAWTGAPPGCLLARFWDASRRRWGEIQEIRPDAAVGGGPTPAPLSAPIDPAPAPPQTIPASAPHPAD